MEDMKEQGWQKEELNHDIFKTMAHLILVSALKLGCFILEAQGAEPLYLYTKQLLDTCCS